MPHFLLILSTLFWGGNYVVGRLLVFQMSPILLSEIRWLLAAFFLFLLYHRDIKQAWPSIKESVGSLFFLACCGQVLFPLNLYIGLQYTTPLNAAIYLSATPCLVLSINKWVFKDYVSQGNIFGVLLSSVGVLYLITEGKFANLKELGMLNKGDLWAIGSAISWAFYCSFLRIKNKKITSRVFVTLSALIGALILLPISVLAIICDHSIISRIQLNLPIMVGILYLVIFPSWLSYLFWSKGISVIGATRGEVYTHMVPLFGGMLSIIFLGNPLHNYHIIGAAWIAIGIYFCSKSTTAAMGQK